jgi:CheY-like chemotaxis protein
VPEHNPTVLIVEDDIDLRNLIVEFLREDFEPVVAGTADEGVSVARKTHPMLILCDLNMPGRNGLHTIEEVRNDPDLSNVPIILMSGQEEPVEAAKFRVKFLPKPFPITTLMEAVAAVLSSRQTVLPA